MKILLMLGKGGSGKTSTTANLGVIAHKEGLKVGLVDADPQATLRDWRLARGAADVPLQTCRADQWIQVLARAERAGLDRLLVDMPPAFVSHTPMFIARADLVLLPMRPTIFDIFATRTWISRLRSSATAFGVVINAAPPRREGDDAPAVRDARAALRSIGVSVWPGQITHRLGIPLAAVSGRSVAETDTDGPAAAEYRALWRAIDLILDPNRSTKDVCKTSPHAA